MAVFRKDNIIFSLNSFAAATLALFIALWIGLPRPFWAMMTVYITSQPLAGAVRSKAVYRLAGTLLGATVAVILVPNFVNQPLLLSFMLALWAGVCVAVSLLDRTPASYTLLLAGYTASLIGFPSVDHPEAIFDLAWSRSVEIGLGVICAALMHSLVFPRPVSRVIALRVTDWIHRADSWLNDLLDEERASQTLGDRRAFALAASDIRILGSHLPFDTERRGDAQGLLHAIHDRMLLLIPHLEAVGDRLGELNRLGGPSEAVGAQLDKAKAWIQSGAPPMEGLDLSDALRYGTQSEAPNTWRDLVQQSLATRLGEAVQALSEAHLLHRRIENPTFPLPPTLQTAISSAMPKPLHADIGLAVRSGVTLIVTVMATSLLWITTGWRRCHGFCVLRPFRQSGRPFSSDPLFRCLQPVVARRWRGLQFRDLPDGQQFRVAGAHPFPLPFLPRRSGGGPKKHRQGHTSDHHPGQRPWRATGGAD